MCVHVCVCEGGSARVSTRPDIKNSGRPIKSYLSWVLPPGLTECAHLLAHFESRLGPMPPGSSHGKCYVIFSIISQEIHL